MGTGIHGGFGNTHGAKNADLIAALESAGVKFTKQNIVFITKDKTGQIVWLETGNELAGLQHILDGNGRTPGHATDFERAFGATREAIPDYLHKVITDGIVVSNELKKVGSREGYERIYYYEGNHYVITGIGTNGFIISAYPKRRKD